MTDRHREEKKRKEKKEEQNPLLYSLQNIVDLALSWGMLTSRCWSYFGCIQSNFSCRECCNQFFHCCPSCCHAFTVCPRNSIGLSLVVSMFLPSQMPTVPQWRFQCKGKEELEEFATVDVMRLGFCTGFLGQSLPILYSRTPLNRVPVATMQGAWRSSPRSGDQS